MALRWKTFSSTSWGTFTTAQWIPFFVDIGGGLIQLVMVKQELYQPTSVAGQIHTAGSNRGDSLTNVQAGEVVTGKAVAGTISGGGSDAGNSV